MNSDVEFIFRLLRKEAWARKRLVMLLYFLTSIVFAGLAWIWPQVYTSSSTTVIEDKNIIRPLMEGTAVTTALAEPSKMASQIMNSRATLNEIIEAGDWVEEDASALEIDEAMERIRGKTEILNIGRNIIQISFKDKNPTRAFKTAKMMSEIFVRESQKIKQRESRSAYEFINSQAEIYHSKLKGAELAIKNFREKNIDSTPGAEQIANERILSLTRQIEDVEIEINGERSKLDALKIQLAGGGVTENSASIAREGTLRTRVSELKNQLEDLRLVYKDTYPDIVQIKSQIDSTEAQIMREIESRNSENKVNKGELADSPIAQELRSQISRSQTNISTLKSRKEQLMVLLTNEQQKINRIKSVEAEINELTRDSDVNLAKYNELLEQRESARISMEMDIANQGIVTRIQEKAFLPANPKGIRFIHLIIAGFILSFAVPLGVVYGLALLDQKVRDQRIIHDNLELPVLASIHPVKNQMQRRMQHLKVATIVLVIGSSWAIYGYEVWLRIQG